MQDIANSSNALPEAVRFVRSLRGGCQAKLIEADNGTFYAIKSPDNPQGGRRVLINEFLGSRVLGHMRIASAPVCPLLVTTDFITANPEMYLYTGHKRTRPLAGIYLGARYEGVPDGPMVYDFLPTALISKVNNLHDFAGVLVADQWLSNADARQCVFTRVASTADRRRRFYAVMIDCGFYLNGVEWYLHESTRTGLYHQPAVYSTVRSSADFEPYIQKAQSIDAQLFKTWLDEMPGDWIEGARAALNAILEKVIRKQASIPRLIEQLVHANPECFPGWTGRPKD